MTIDLDALEKLADEAVKELRRFAFDAAPMESAKDRAAARKVMRKADATILSLIAELKEARGLLQRWRSDLPTEALEDITDAFLARNGKGEG